MVRASSLEEVVRLRRGELPPTVRRRIGERVAQLSEGEVFGAAPPVPAVMAAVEREGAVGRVTMVEGWVDYDEARGTVVLRGDGVALPLWWVGGVLLPVLAGLWRLYALPCGLVVGAEAAGGRAEAPGLPSAEHVARYRARLAVAQGVEVGELEALRGGSATPLSVRRARQAAARRWVYAGLAWFGAAVLVGLARFAPSAFWPSGGEASPAVQWALAAACGGVGCVLAVRAWRAGGFGAEPVMARRGTPRIGRRAGAGGNRERWIELEERRFGETDHPVVSLVHRVLHRGTPIVAYVTARGGVLVAVEPAES